MNDSILRIVQAWLESTVSIHWVKLAPNSWRYCYKSNWEAENEENSSAKEKPRFESIPEEAYNSVDSLSVMNKIIRHAGSGPQLKYVVR